MRGNLQLQHFLEMYRQLRDSLTQKHKQFNKQTQNYTLSLASIFPTVPKRGEEMGGKPTSLFYFLQTSSEATLGMLDVMKEQIQFQKEMSHSQAFEEYLVGNLIKKSIYFDLSLLKDVRLGSSKRELVLTAKQSLGCGFADKIFLVFQTEKLALQWQNLLSEVLKNESCNPISQSPSKLQKILSRFNIDIKQLFMFPSVNSLAKEYQSLQLEKFLERDPQLGTPEEKLQVLRMIFQLIDNKYELATFFLGKIASIKKSFKISEESNSKGVSTRPNIVKSVQPTKDQSSKLTSQVASLTRECNQLKSQLQNLKKNKVATNLSKINQVWGPNTRQQLKKQNYEGIKKQIWEEVRQELRNEVFKEAEQQATQKTQQLQKEILGYQARIDSLEQNNKALIIDNNQLPNLKAEIDTLKGTIAQLQSALQQTNQEIAKLNQQIETQQLSSEVQGKQLARLRDEIYLHIFEGQALTNCLERKKFLKAEIQAYSNKEIVYTKLLYRYDPLNKTNYHKYFDNHEHFCVVVRLKNGRLVAGYSMDALVQKVPPSKGGLILSLSEFKTFKLIEGRRAVVYDNYFLIFGNSQFRLKNGQLSFFTNFGINNEYYLSGGAKYTVLVGENQPKQVEAETYQIFQVQFRQ